MTTTTPQAGPLHSDHINYLIFRYLQEAGLESSATAFYRDWNRPAQFRDPEDFPFAPFVHRHELVSVIQDGLYHDELLSRARDEGRRFKFTTASADTGSRPGTAAKGKGRVGEVRREPEEFPTPPPKRQRTNEEGRHGPNAQVNGAAELTDPDAASPSVGEAEDDAEAGSPAVQTPELEIVEIPERYDSLDVAVQTEGKTGPKTSTMYWRIDKPDGSILHSMFSLAKGSRTLFTGGEGITRFYDVPSSFEERVEKIPITDDSGTPASAVVTACAWHPDGYTLARAVDLPRKIGVGGKQERRQDIRSLDARTSSRVAYLSSPVMEPSGIVLALRYSWDGSKLLAVRTNGSRGIVEVWNTDSPQTNEKMRSEKVRAWSFFEGRILDAAWIAPLDFVVCGDDGLLVRYRFAIEDDGDLDYTSNKIRAHNLETLPLPQLRDNGLRPNFDKIVAAGPENQAGNADTVCFAAASSEERMVVQSSVDLRGRNSDTNLLMPRTLSDRLTALEFRPPHKQSSIEQHLLAVALESGRCILQETTGPDRIVEMATLIMIDQSPALALAWSPDGSHLAVSGVDVVQVWEILPLVHSYQRRLQDHKQLVALVPDPLVTWRREIYTSPQGLRNGELTANGTANGESDEPQVGPSLSWSADGESLALAVGREVAIIRFRPALQSSREGTNGVNGHTN